MHCSNCGSPVEENAKFCANCGTPLAAQQVDESVTATVQIPVPQDQTQEIPAPQDQTQEIPAPQDRIQDIPAPADQTREIPKPQDQQIPQPQQTTPMPPQGAPVPPQSTPPSGAAASPGKSNGMAVAALVCGIAAIVLSGTILFGIILGILAIVFAGRALKIASDGKAKAGKICGIIGLVFSVISLVVVIVFGVPVVSYIIDENPSLITTTPSLTEPSSSSSSKPSLSSSSSVAKVETYENARFGFSIDIPDGFAITSESVNGDGATISNRSLNVTSSVYGYNNVNNLTPEQFVETKWNGSPTSYTETDDSMAMLFQSDGTMIHIIIAYVGAGSINELDINFPDTDEYEDQLEAAEELALGFEVGNIAMTC